MLNDQWTLERRSRRARGSFAGACQRFGLSWILAGGLGLVACGEENDSVTYGDDVRPIFNLRCTTCHRTGSPIRVNIQNPYQEVECVTGADGLEVCNGGLVNMRNTWSVMNPGEMPERNVEPGDPDNSFLMWKLTGDVPSNGDGGQPMPLQVEWETKAADIQLLADWITANAPNGPFPSGSATRNFDPDITTIFGTQDDDRQYTGGKCLFCHYDGTPNPPNLSDPFSRESDGVIGVNARYRADRVRIVPGNPDDSFLMQKVRADRPQSEIGANMPYSYSALSESQLEVVRQWILQGALP